MAAGLALNPTNTHAFGSHVYQTKIKPKRFSIFSSQGNPYNPKKLNVVAFFLRYPIVFFFWQLGGTFFWRQKNPSSRLSHLQKKQYPCPRKKNSFDHRKTCRVFSAFLVKVENVQARWWPGDLITYYGLIFSYNVIVKIVTSNLKWKNIFAPPPPIIR